MSTPLAIHAAQRFPTVSAPIRFAAFVLAGIGLLTLASKIQVPFWPVPLTLQVAAVLFIGLVYGRGLGTATVGAWLMAGLAGLPVFAGAAAGPAYFMGPTGGYLLGFLIAAAVMGEAASRGLDRRMVTLVPVTVLGTALIYLPGVAWLGSVIGDFGRAVEVGMLPFLLGDALKCAIVTVLIGGAWRMSRD